MEFVRLMNLQTGGVFYLPTGRIPATLRPATSMQAPRLHGCNGHFQLECLHGKAVRPDSPSFEDDGSMHSGTDSADTHRHALVQIFHVSGLEG